MKSPVTSISIEPAMKEALEQIASEFRLTLPEFARRLLAEAMLAFVSDEQLPTIAMPAYRCLSDQCVFFRGDPITRHVGTLEYLVKRAYEPHAEPPKETSEEVQRPTGGRLLMFRAPAPSRDLDTRL